MVDIIRLLPDTVANQIAAGEVIQRPASVIKELVENASDAGATEIHIQVLDAGRTLIKVSDNGRGMSPTDARMAFERHATSKIKQASDLFSLRTMGFRGEALPSICAISQVELRSAVAGEQMGTKLIIEGSEVIEQEPCLCPVGTTIMVKNIFYNVPVRRKFLKSDNVELSNVIREFERMALVNHNIRFTLDTGSRKRELRGAGFKQRITDLWKGTLNPELLPVDVETGLVHISGFVSRPEHARRRNALQYLIVNGRCMRHPYFHRGIVSCFERLIAPDAQPCYFLRFDVNPADIDVNIHPTKNEIKFEHEQEIYRLLVSAVNATLGKYGVVPSIDFTSDALEVRPLENGENVSAPPPASDMHYNPFQQARQSSWQQPSFDDWNELYKGFSTADVGLDGQPNLPLHQAATMSVADIQNLNADTAPQSLSLDADDGVEPLCLQLNQCYIVAPQQDGLMLIDQHRAHMSVLYHDFIRKKDTARPIARQNILFGEEIKLDDRQSAVLKEALPKLTEMGIELHQHGEKWIIDSLPVAISSHEGCDIILQTIDALQTESDQYGKSQITSSSLHERMALALARAGAVRCGQKLTQAEMEQLLSSLLKLPEPNTGPDGNRVIYILKNHQINKFFQ